MVTFSSFFLSFFLSFRDGPIHHITLMHRQEVSQVLKTIPNILTDLTSSDSTRSVTDILMDTIVEKVEDDWVDLGLGEQTQGKNKVKERKKEKKEHE
jgi:hypothetical protein